MKLVKCPRCELNYIFENEKICSVCKREVHGEIEPDDMIELCSECGENPVEPGQELCAYCLKELQRRSPDDEPDDVNMIHRDGRDIDMTPVSTMDEIELEVSDGDDEDFDDDDDEDEDNEELEEDIFAEEDDDDDEDDEYEE